jgi:hypothetical protein
MTFTDEELKIIYNAVRYYQMQRVPMIEPTYDLCSSVLEKIYPSPKSNE